VLFTEATNRSSITIAFSWEAVMLRRVQLSDGEEVLLPTYFQSHTRLLAGVTCLSSYSTPTQSSLIILTQVLLTRPAPTHTACAYSHRLPSTRFLTDCPRRRSRFEMASTPSSAKTGFASGVPSRCQHKMLYFRSVWLCKVKL
jgi:hypothetical protein